MSTRLFEDINALDSLRNSDFDSVSAYGEVIDNSIEAGAKSIKIRFDTRTGSRGYEHIECIVFGDDGHGMDFETIQNCMQIGWSSRYNSRDGIGRFGVGMTMAAIHECKKVEVYSKEPGKEWRYTFIDLDKIKSKDQDGIPQPEKKDPPSDIAHLAGDNSGTIIIWSKYDRQTENASKLRDEAIVWIGRTYRYFLWEDDVEIYVDGQRVPAIDPLYLQTDLTAFPDDPISEAFEPIIINWKVDEHDAPPGAPDSSDIKILMSLLPEEFRKQLGKGGGAMHLARHIPSNEGISILRNKREVFYGNIPFWKAAGKGWTTFEDIDRWWGCEIHFDAVLDRAFTVKNIKRGAVPNSTLKSTIKGLIHATRETCLEQVREHWAKNKQAAEQKKAEEEGLDRSGDHIAAEQAASATPTDTSELDKDKDFDKESKELLDRYKEQFDEDQQSKLKALFQSQPFTILEDNWRGHQFMESNHLGGKAVLEYNMGHIFFQEVTKILTEVENGADGHKASKNLKTLLDLLLISYAKGEARFSSDQKMSAEEYVEYMRTNWGQYLNNYVSTWKSEN